MKIYNSLWVSSPNYMDKTSWPLQSQNQFWCRSCCTCFVILWKKHRCISVLHP